MTPLFSGSVRRFGLVGDVHGQATLLEQALAFLAAQPELDALLCTGDVPAKNEEGVTATVRCCQLLREAGVLTVRGNHDRWHTDVENLAALYPPEALAFLRSLPSSRSFETSRGPLLLCHGIGDDDMSGVYKNAGGASRDRWRHLAGLQKLEILVRHYPYRLILLGHTHLAMAESHAGAFLINGGTLLADKEPPTVSIVDLSEGGGRFAELGPDGFAFVEEFVLG